MDLKWQVSSWSYRCWHFTNGNNNRQANSIGFVEFRGAMCKAYEDAKEDPNDVKTLLQVIKQFLEKVSLRRASQRNSDQHQSHVASNEFVPQPSIDSYL